MSNFKNQILVFFVLVSNAVLGQFANLEQQASPDITISPYPFDVTDEITITIKSNNSCNSMGSQTLYIHSGVGTGATQALAWKYVTGNWGLDDGVGKMTNNGNGTHSITLTPKTYYQIPDGEEANIKGMGMVIRNPSGSTKYKYTNDSGVCSFADYFVGVGKFQLNVVSPAVVNNGTISKNSGEIVNVNITSTEIAAYKIFKAGVEIFSTLAQSAINYNITVDNTATYRVEATSGGSTQVFSFSVLVDSTPVVEALPAGFRDGINYHSDDQSKVTLVLHAPNKSSVYVKGDFSDWMLDSKYQMKVSHSDLSNENLRFWITLDNLQSNVEYAFQYFVDGEKNIADPYSDKVLDQWNDSYIGDDVYPNLKAYPVGLTEGIVSVFQTGQTPYSWQIPNFVKPAKDNLIIYELLVRDFVNQHSYQSIIDTLDYLEKLNINAIELMPVNEFEGNESWGYNPSFMFAPDKYYGPKDKLKELIDEAHARGIAVIIDIVMNHSFGQSPFVSLYKWHNAGDEIVFDEATPWFNTLSPNQVYKWGADFNHESIHTKALLDSVNSYWLTEYKVDGFRFDFTKGFTNKSGDGWSYDASRIALLKRMYDHIESVSPGSYVILEHLAANAEEKELAEHGMMLWGNMNYNFSEAAMGYNDLDKSDLGWASHTSRGWSKAHLIAYSSSHDEERIAYKVKNFGRASGSYNTKNHATAMKRMQLQSLFLFAIPGPKMIWMFDELGYDISIDNPCRVCNKPILWNYAYDLDRIRVYNLNKAIMHLKKTQAAFNTSTYTMNLDNGPVKSIIYEHADMNVVLLGNFDINYQNPTPSFPNTGTWYNYFTGAEYQVSVTNQTVSLAPGEFKIFTSKKLDTPNLDESIFLSIDEISYDRDGNDKNLNVYPTPVQTRANITYSISARSDVKVEIYDIRGAVIKSYVFKNQASGSHTLSWQLESDIRSGIYFVRVSTAIESLSRKIIIE